MRLFTAIHLNGEIREELIRLQRILNKRAPELRSVKAEQLHLTLKFLGEVEEAKLPAALAALKSCAAACPAFTATLEGRGCFPERGKIRVAWIGLASPSSALPRLSRSLEECFAVCGFPEEARDFSPHITIARAGRRGAPPRVREAVSSLTPSPLSQEVSSLFLMQSMLQPAGPVYTVIKEEPLSR